MPLKQDNRAGVLTTPLGKDVLVLMRFDGEEALSEPFEFRVEALSEEPDVNFDPAIGQQCSVTLETFKGEKREFHGILAEAQWVGVTNHLFSYQLVLRPWLWLLSHTADCRIFNNKKVPEIIKYVFEQHGFSNGNDFDFTLSNSYEPVEYCVQYRETDFNFVSRLMEKEGIYYFFEHKNGKHKMVLVDDKGSHRPVPNLATIPYRPPVGSFHPQEQRIEDWTAGRRFRANKVSLKDYNYEKPKADMLGDASGKTRYSPNMEIYDYPGKHKERSKGADYAKIEIEAEQAQDRRRQGSGEAPSLYPGGKTKLEDHPADGQNVEYLIVRAVHSYYDQSYLSGPAEEGAGYDGRYEFLPSDRQFRAMLLTPKPRIYGIQTAEVVTKDEGGSEEIDVEKLTEIYVRFHWDHSKSPKTRSCKIRVAQVWSGKKWGGQFIPRVGQEAVIEFLEGDPDRPLVIGTVYNDEYKPPYDLPGKKTIAGIKSDSTKGGGGYNELSFDDDKRLGEKITLHAEKDHNVTVRHAETWKIGETFEVPTGQPSREVTIKMGDDKLTLDSGSRLTKVAMNSELIADLEVKVNAKVQILHECGASKITMTPISIQLECGASKISMTPASITIDAPMISLSGLMVKIN